MELVIRPAEADDAPALLALLRQLMTESTTFTMTQDIDGIAAAQESDNITQLQATTNNVILLAASDEGELFGVISAAAIPGHPRIAEIGVAILAAYQGFGLAQALLEELINWAHDYSTVDVLALTVQAHNAAAIHIYEKYGFERVPDSDDMVLDGAGQSVPAFDMMLTVK